MDIRAGHPLWSGPRATTGLPELPAQFAGYGRAKALTQTIGNTMIRIPTSPIRTVAAAAALVCSMAGTAAADAPTQIGAFKDWSAYTTGTGDSKTCYALSQPKTKLPKGANRDPVFFLVSDWPARKAKGEPEVVPGYSYKENSTVTARIGNDKFTFFTKNDGGTGGAWVKEVTDEARLVAAMRSGSTMTVTGISDRGTLTTDTYSLSGISEALDKIHQACGM